MADTYRVSDVVDSPVGDTDCWRVLLEKPGGTAHQLTFPKATLTWRVAEYGIDPTDVDTLLDVVLHEPFMPDPAVDDPPAAAAIRTRIGGVTVPTTLATARTRDDARTAHLARIAHTKAHIVCVTSEPVAGVDPLDAIRRHLPDPAQVQQIYAVVRNLHARQGIQDPPIDASAASRHTELHGTA
jgi:hypothetical protein